MFCQSEAKQALELETTLVKSYSVELAIYLGSG